MKNVVGFNSQEIKNRTLIFHGVFGRIENLVSSRKYYKSHLFNKNELKKTFREYLYNINDISRKEELEKLFGKEWTLRILDGSGENSCEIDLDNKIFMIYYDDYESYYRENRVVKNNSNTIKDLYDKAKIPSSNNVTNIIEKIAEIIFNEKRCIPTEKELESFFYGQAFINKCFGEKGNYKTKGKKMYKEFKNKNYKYCYLFADSTDLYWNYDETIKIIDKYPDKLFGCGLLMVGLSNNFATDSSNIFNNDLHNLDIKNNIWD